MKTLGLILYAVATILSANTKEVVTFENGQKYELVRETEDTATLVNIKEENEEPWVSPEYLAELEFNSRTNEW